MFQRVLTRLTIIFSHEQYQDKSSPTKGWSYSNGYENDYDTHVYPLRGLVTNKHNELNVRLRMNSHDMVNSKKEIWFGQGVADGFVVSCLYLPIFNTIS